MLSWKQELHIICSKIKKINERYTLGQQNVFETRHSRKYRIAIKLTTIRVRCVRMATHVRVSAGGRVGAGMCVSHTAIPALMVLLAYGAG